MPGVRHVRSVCFAAVLAAAVWVLSGAGFDDGTGGLLTALLAGAAYAVLIFAPISPAGPVTAGVAFLVASVWALSSPSSYADLWPAGVSWADLGQPGHGPAAVLAVPMLATAFLARRWAGEPREFPPVGRLGGAPGEAQPADAPAAAGAESPVPPSSDPDRTVMMTDGEQTQFIRAPEPPAPEPAALVPQLVPELVSVTSEPAPVIPQLPADETMVTSARPADETMAIPLPSPEAPASGDVTQFIPRDLGGDRQVIKTPAPADGEQTQVIRPPGPAEAGQSGAVTPAGPPEAEESRVPDAEQTRVIHVDAAEPDEEQPLSIAGAERPDPTADPTTRLRQLPEPGTAPDTPTPRPAEPEPVPAGRPQSATDLERPADEAADDTRRLRMPSIPAPRRQPDDEAG